MPDWEFVQSLDLVKNLQVFKTRPNPSTGAHGPDVIYDNRKPEETVTLVARSVPLADFNTERDKLLTRNTTHAFTTEDGVTYTGYVVGVSGKRIEGLDHYDVTLRLRRTDV